MRGLIDIYPFNLAFGIFGNTEEAFQIYIPGIFAALDTLTEREADILQKRFGDKMTLKSIGEMHGVGAERIRQIAFKAMRKMRHPSRTNMFKAVSATELQEQNIKFQKLSQEYEILSRALELCTAKKATTVQSSISELDLSTRSYNCLRGAGKDTLRDITEMTRDELAKIRNMGRKSVEEVVRKIEICGLILKEGQDES